MPEHPGPGVFVEMSEPSTASVRQIAADRRLIRTEDDAMSRRRWAAARTTVVFFGFAERGPFSDPVEVTEWRQFVEVFGGHIGGAYLAYAVYGFLANGGTSCYVVRLPEDLGVDHQHLQRWLDTHDDVSVVCAPDAAAGQAGDEGVVSFYRWLITLCEYGDMFALVDLPDLEPQGAYDWRTQRVAIDSKAAGMYYPWLTVDDPVYGYRRKVPPSGHVAGVLARNDLLRGFHTAPGNLTVHQAEDVAVHLSREERGFLTPVGINPLVLSPGRGVVVWGARTLSSDPDWRFLRRHRLVTFILRQLRAQVRAENIEPTEEDLPAAVSELCHLLWRSGALWGESADDAYAVSLATFERGLVAVDCVVAVEQDFSVLLRVVYRHE